MDSKGKIFLLGVGPGDPGLLTVRALEVLRKCTLVVYDEQVPRPILDRFPDMTERASVTLGEQNDADERLRVNESLATQARQGHRVARVCLGDPFLMGHGGEDAIFFRSVGVDVEVIPGVSLALAAPTLSGIPLMQRGIFKSVFFTAGPYLGNAPITGSVAPNPKAAVATAPAEAEEPAKATRVQIRKRRKGTIPWGMGSSEQVARQMDQMSANDLAWWKAISACADTLLLAEVTDSLGVVQRGLIEGGRSPAEPVALIVGASRPTHQVLTSCLGSMVEDFMSVPRTETAVLVIGDVVNLRSHISFRDLNAVKGYRVALLDPAGNAMELVAPLERAGMLVSRFPVVDRRPAAGLVDRLVAIRRELRRLTTLVFHGPREIEGFFQGLAHGSLDPHTISGSCRILYFGAGSEDVLRRWGHVGTLVSEQFSAPTLKRFFHEEGRQEMVLLAGNPTDFDALATWLKPKCIGMWVVPVWEEGTSPDDILSLRQMIESGDLDALVFTGDREVEVLEEGWGEADFTMLVENLTLFSTGEEVAAALRARFVDEFLVADSARPEAVLHALSTHVTHLRRG
jgi:uroporphyrinogen III methyltransferase / synthase